MSGGITFTSALNTGGVYIRYFQSPSIPVALTELESFSANLGYNLNTFDYLGTAVWFDTTASVLMV